eukprot:TRINITY_DN33642_c0_g1_i1.p1 TRINITY_DN33642_c0_g1~~TRINITY_DN33642_c0_g1_i1.p1  ORF type:complete len:485 (+),score=46.84 TRINITY_DN33642_c0_g1_i1:79-1455(+)
MAEQPAAQPGGGALVTALCVTSLVVLLARALRTPLSRGRAARRTAPAAPASLVDSPQSSSGAAAQSAATDPLQLDMTQFACSRSDWLSGRVVTPSGPVLRCARPGLLRAAAADTRRCLSGRHVVFFGDSLARYQFQSLVELVDGGAWPRPRARNSSNWFLRHDALAGARGQLGVSPRGRRRGTAQQRSPVWEREWKSWEDFYVGGTARLGGRLCCDCFRADRQESTADEWAMRRDNRYYYWRGVRLSYVMTHGDHGSSGAVAAHAPGCPGALGADASPQLFRKLSNATLRAPLWRERIEYAAAALSRHAPAADAVVYVSGWDARWRADPERVRTAFSSLGAMLRPGGVGVYLTRPVMPKPKQPSTLAQEGMELREVRRARWGVADAFGVTSTLAEAALRAPAPPLPPPPRPTSGTRGSSLGAYGCDGYGTRGTQGATCGLLTCSSMTSGISSRTCTRS